MAFADRMETVAGGSAEPLSPAERSELSRLRRQVAEQDKELAFLGKPPRTLAGNELHRPGLGYLFCLPNRDGAFDFHLSDAAHPMAVGAHLGVRALQPARTAAGRACPPARDSHFN
jgi:hypothetical protein